MMYKKYISFFVILFSVFFLNASNEVSTQLAAPENHSLLKQIELWYADNMNYLTIMLLMLLESGFSFIPSELVITPAAYVSLEPGSSLNIYGVVFFSTFGSLLGSIICYYIATSFGRIALYRFAESRVGKFLFLSKRRLEKAEALFQKHSKISTCIARIFPGVRHLISIPAGLSRMNIFMFSLFTFIGSLGWNGALAFFGYLLHEQSEWLEKYSYQLSYMLVGIIVLTILMLVVRFIMKRKRRKK